MFGISFRSIVYVSAAVVGLILLGRLVVGHYALSAQAEREEDNLQRRVARVRLKTQTVLEYENRRIDLRTAAQRFAEWDSSDPVRLAELRELIGGEPDDRLFAKMVLEQVLSYDAVQSNRPPFGALAREEFERVYGGGTE